MKHEMLKSFGLSAGRKLSAALLGLSAIATCSTQAQVVYVTSYTGTDIRALCPPVCDMVGVSLSGSTEITAAPGVPSRNRAYYGNTPPVSWSITPTLPTPGAVYKIETAHNSGTGGNTSCSLSVLVTLSTEDGQLSSSCTNTTVFQRSFGGPVWNLIGYITNNPGVTQPKISFAQTGGTVNNSPERLYIDAFKFTEVNVCLGVAADINATGPLAAGQTYVPVTGVDAGATNITVYADGSPIGTLDAPSIVAGSNAVPTTSPLFEGAAITATQTKTGCTSVQAASGPIVGSGANPTVKAFLSCWKSDTYAGPIGTNSSAPGTGIYYSLKGTSLTGGSQSAPQGGEILAPSSCWQTVTFLHDQAVQMDNAASLTSFDPFAAIDGLVFAIDWQGAPDTGPYDIYVDQIMNGDVVIEDFESYPHGSTNRFNRPAAATPFPNPTIAYLASPNSSTISTNNAFDGSKALRVQWQWANKSTVRWARIQANATPGKTFPQVDTTKPITIRYLVLPVGETTNKLAFSNTVSNETVTVGGNASFTVNPLGDGPFTYQWSFAGSDLLNETNNVLSKTNVQEADSGLYAVLVTGTSCNTTNYAKLTVSTVVNPPTLEYSVSGDQITFTWSGTFTLQSRDAVDSGTWTDISSTSGHAVSLSAGTTQFFRLRQ